MELMPDKSREFLEDEFDREGALKERGPIDLNVLKRKISTLKRNLDVLKDEKMRADLQGIIDQLQAEHDQLKQRLNELK